MVWSTVSSWSCFCWLYRAFPSLAAKNKINLNLVLTIWWCPCIESSLVLLEEGVCYDQCIFFVFALRKWALGSIITNKASGGDGISADLFHVLKDDAVKVLHTLCQQIWKTHQWPQAWKRSVFIYIPKKDNAKECSNYHRTALTSHVTKVMLKILQTRLQRYVNWKITDVFR